MRVEKDVPGTGLSNVGRQEKSVVRWLQTTCDNGE